MMENGNTDVVADRQPKLTPQLEPTLTEGIALILRRWWIFQEAVRNEWGGRGSRAIADQLHADVFSWFTQSADALFIYDLEDILYQATDYLNIGFDDDNMEVAQVAKHLMILYEECLEGKTQFITKLRETNSQHSSSRQTVVNDNKDDSSTDDDNNDDDSSDMMVDTPEAKSELPPEQVQNRGTSAREAAPAEDGWTVVSSRGRKGRRN